MAVTENTSRGFTQITPDGSLDWDSTVSFPEGMSVSSILFFPSEVDDIICIKEGSDSGPVILKAKDVEGRGLLLELKGNLIHPYLDQSECAFSNASAVVITIYQA